ncbi:alpha/beta hydrolase [Phenylobacterium sp.]|uniref:alpha/beta fold hydrolase n=1 Tax=Phenylobacterium sp. TaxID=1871053 RepID=UPI0028962DF4|nr:alpha/beta hydrolase [Phenylobacterium sp.]
MRPLLLALALALSAPPALAAAPGEAGARPELLARLPDGRRLNFRCAGQGAPTVLLEGGYAADSLAWGKVRAILAKSYRVCAYDRAGSGFSDPGPLPRDGAAIARDLDRGLRAARIPGPYILVGHSAGALYVRLFSNRRPGDVVGMVLVDPSVEHQDRRFAALFGPGAAGLGPLRERAARCLAAARAGKLPAAEAPLDRCTPAPSDNPVDAARRAQALRPSTWQARISELDNLWGPTSAALDAGRQAYGDLPLIVLTADGTYAAAPQEARQPLADLWWGLHRELARRSTRGVSRRIEGSSHLMMSDRPDAIAEAVAQVAAQANMLKR